MNRNLLPKFVQVQYGFYNGQTGRVVDTCVSRGRTLFQIEIRVWGTSEEKYAWLEVSQFRVL